MAIHSMWKINEDVFSLQGDKSLGPYGFPMFSFHVFWEDMARYLCNVIKEFLSSNILKEINFNFIDFFLENLWFFLG